MTDNEIIRIAENCCSDKPNCACCLFDDGTKTVEECMEKLIQHCVDLINRQKAEIEELQRRIVFWREDLNYQPEIERAEAIKEFAERFEKAIETTPNINAHFRFALLRYAKQIKDNLVKEMVGD